VVTRAALVRIGAAVLPGPALETMADAELASSEIDQWPPQPECLSLAQSERERDRPAGGVPLLAGRGEQPPGFVKLSGSISSSSSRVVW
jgi:hypothetical protein